MDSLRVILEPILRKYLRDATRARVQRRMTAALPEIARKMAKKQVTPEHAAAGVVIRDALFRLWRSVISSGDLADLVRDLQDDRVVAALAPRVTAETPVADVVAWTMDEALNLAF